MIKGHAVIELKDVGTGEVQRVEHDNMVTNGLKYCLTPWLGKFSYATGGSTPQKMPDETKETWKSGNRSMMNHLLGGIFLFQNNLEEDVDNTAFPLDNPLTGKASWDAYNGMDTYRGSYNENESGLQEDGSYKHVWDFSTDQANGQISALSLTTYKGGICGDGFKDWSSQETVINEEPFFNLGEIRINESGKSGKCAPFIKASSNEVYYISDPYCLQYNSNYADRYIGNSGKIVFKKRKFPLTALSPFYDYYNQYYTEDVEVEVPEEFVTYAANDILNGKTSDSYLYIYKKYTQGGGIFLINSGESFKLLRIRKSDLAADVVTLTNTIPYRTYTGEISFTDDFCFMVTYSAPWEIYRINMSNNDIEMLERNQKSILRKIGDYIYDNEFFCINPETMAEKKHPNFTLSKSNWEFQSTEKIAPNIYLQFVRYVYSPDNEYDLANIYISANTLMTINNLSSPVVKTAAQTMKVTYTIQETEQ